MKNKFNIWRKSNSIWILRNDVFELEIHTKQPKVLEKYLRELLPVDYDQYLAAFDLEYSVHTSEWWINVLKNDEGIRDMFTRAKPRALVYEKV